MELMRFIFIVAAIVLFQIALILLAYTTDMNKNQFGDKVSSIGLRSEMTECKAATEGRIELGKVVRQDAAIRFSNLACMLAKRQ